MASSQSAVIMVLGPPRRADYVLARAMVRTSGFPNPRLATILSHPRKIASTRSLSANCQLLKPSDRFNGSSSAGHTRNILAKQTTWPMHVGGMQTPRRCTLVGAWVHLVNPVVGGSGASGRWVRGKSQ